VIVSNFISEQLKTALVFR